MVVANVKRLYPFEDFREGFRDVLDKKGRDIFPFQNTPYVFHSFQEKDRKKTFFFVFGE